MTGLLQERGRARTDERRDAEQLYLSVTTVKSYANSLFTKLGVDDRVQATVLAYESGLITPHRPDL